MGNPARDETGKRYGKWSVIKRGANRGTAAVWLVQCDCGNQAEVIGTCLRNGESTQCKPCGVTKHGLSKSPEYKVWAGILSRTRNENDPSYPNYGGRGIKVSPEWRNSFAQFLADMGQIPEGMTLERLDNNGGYSNENCVWADKAEQSRNRRTTVNITYQGKTQCMKDWATELGIGYSTLAARVAKHGLYPPLIFKEKK